MDLSEAHNKGEERNMEVSVIRILMCTCGMNRYDKVRNEYIRGRLYVTKIDGNMRENKLS